MIITTPGEFQAQHENLPLVPVVGEILGDLDTPVSTFLKATQGPNRFLLESVEDGTHRGRFSIIGDQPIFTFQTKDGVSTFKSLKTDEEQVFENNPFEALKEVMNRYIHKREREIPFMNGGFFGFLGYDSVRYIEELPKDTIDDQSLPDIQMFIPQKIIVFDNLFHKINIIFFVIPNGNAENQYRGAVSAINKIIEDVRTIQPKRGKYLEKQNGSDFKSNVNKERFEDIVRKAKHYIREGDIFQVVLSQRLEVETDSDPFDIYRALRAINPSPYMFYLDLEGVQVFGSSPETLVKLEGKTVTVRPIAGTRRRGHNLAEDQELEKELLADEKEKAEHTMLVDLGRNDIGRIAEYGTVKLHDLMKIEKYSHVIHIVSTVKGQLAEDMDAVDVFRACFPAGTVSGAPKVRSMEIIEELEPNQRNIYAGAVGYFSFDGDMDVWIAIRTIVMRNGKAYLQAGAGIVADSVPETEYEETLNKARGLMRAVEYAKGGLV